MLRIIVNTSASGAKSYYSTADYYTHGQELEGVWRGLGAERLGLSGEIAKADWDRLCDNINPATGGKLMPRMNKERRVGYDLNFHAPKSLSVLYALTKDERLLDAFRDAVNDTMNDMEREMQTRVRKGGQDTDRTTGNLLWGEVVHFTARPVDGVPDPHLHAHCFTFNTTFDPVESRWKAGQFAGLMRDAPYFEAVFHARLARSIERLGVPVVRTATGWEIDLLPKSLLAKFSRRTAEIEKQAAILGITDPELKDQLGAKTRKKKNTKLTPKQLDEHWQGQLSEFEQAAVDQVKAKVGSTPIQADMESAKDAVRIAVGHHFERSAVVPERVMLATAMKNAVGMARPEQVKDLLNREQLISRDLDGRRMLTSREVLAEEQAWLTYAREGKGTCKPLGDPDRPLSRDWLSDEQKRAVRHVITSPDKVILVRGAAGTGKTTMLQEAAEQIEAGGKRVYTFAPSAKASHDVLKHDAGFKEADTLAMLLTSKELQEKARNNVIWIDEAGQIGSRDAKRLFGLAHQLNARVVLSGDRKQQGSVTRGSVLRLLEQEAGLIPAELRSIRRQSGQYKLAVEALEKGRVHEGIARLDELGWIRQVPTDERYKELAKCYLDAQSLPGETLVICPTHGEANKVTSEIRSGLIAAGKLDKPEMTVTSLRPMHLTEAQKHDPFVYVPGDVIEYHQSAPGHRKGERIVVGTVPIEPQQAEHYSVYRPVRLSLAVGDRIRITKNRSAPRKSTDQKRLFNGDVYTVKGFTTKGDIELSNGSVLPKDWSHIDYGYVQTSYSSQGKSVDRALIANSWASQAAASLPQVYVSVSRGKKQALIFVDNKQEFIELACKSDERLSATELVTMREHPGHRMAREEQQQRPEPQQAKQPPIKQHVHDRTREEAMSHER